MSELKDVKFARTLTGKNIIKQAEADIKEGASRITIGGNIKDKVHVASVLRDKHGKKVEVSINERGRDLESEYEIDTDKRKKYKKPVRLSSSKIFDMGKR